jgi:hypothetical protein
MTVSATGLTMATGDFFSLSYTCLTETACTISSTHSLNELRVRASHQFGILFDRSVDYVWLHTSKLRHRRSFFVPTSLVVSACGGQAEEGRILTRIHRSRERSRKLIENKKASVCPIQRKPAWQDQQIEAHHVKPVHTLAAGVKTKVEDLVLLCSNCHRIVHNQRPWLTVEELRQLIKD